jgi:hypothetical protein
VTASVAEPEAQSEAEPESGPSPLTGLRVVGDLLGLVVPTLTLVTGLFYYFGWVRTGATFDYFGVDRSVLDFSSQDYVLRSVGVAFRPAALVIAVLIAVTLIRAGLRFDWSAGRFPRTGTYLPGFLLVVSLVLGGLGFAGIVSRSALPPLFSAMALGTGALLATALLDRRSRLAETRRAEPAYLRWLMVAVTVLATFWATAVYAQSSGSTLAQSIERHQLARPGVVIYSQQRLQIAGPGVVAVSESTGAGYGFRYSGLRLLIRTQGHWLLMAEGWSRTNGSTIIRVTENPTVRMDLLPPH